LRDWFVKGDLNEASSSHSPVHSSLVKNHAETGQKESSFRIEIDLVTMLRFCHSFSQTSGWCVVFFSGSFRAYSLLLVPHETYINSMSLVLCGTVWL